MSAFVIVILNLNSISWIIWLLYHYYNTRIIISGNLNSHLFCFNTIKRFYLDQNKIILYIFYFYLPLYMHNINGMRN